MIGSLVSNDKKEGETHTLSFDKIIDKFLIEDTWALVKQMVVKGAGEDVAAGGTSEAAALKVNKPEFILLILQNVIDTKPEYLL